MVANHRRPVYTVHELLDGYQINPDHHPGAGRTGPTFCRLPAGCDRFHGGGGPALAGGQRCRRGHCPNHLRSDSICRYRKGVWLPHLKRVFYQSIRSAFGRQMLLTWPMICCGSRRFVRAPMIAISTSTLWKIPSSIWCGVSHTTGRNLRITVQIRPGLIHDYRRVKRKRHPLPPNRHLADRMVGPEL